MQTDDSNDAIPELDMTIARPARHLLRAGLETQEEYDARSKWVQEVRARGLIILDSDIAGEFPTPEAVNDGLRELLRLRQH